MTDQPSRHGIVRWMNADTGEIKERARSGVDYDEFGGEVIEYEWEQTPLELALAVVPDLEAAIRAAGARDDIEISVRRRAPRAGTPGA